MDKVRSSLRKEGSRGNVAQGVLDFVHGPFFDGFVHNAQPRAPCDLPFDGHRFSPRGLYEDEKDIRSGVFRGVTNPDLLSFIATLHHAHMAVLINGGGDHATDELARLSSVIHLRPGAHREVCLVRVQLDEPRRRVFVAD